jgi:hypothetical protein
MPEPAPHKCIAQALRHHAHIMTTHIQIVRKWQTDNSTISELITNGGLIRGFVLERPGPDTTESGLRLRIPEGTYQLKWHNSSLPKVRGHNPVPLLFNNVVPASRYILIHNGNFPHNTDGCLLVGKTRGTDLVNNSVEMLNELKKFLNECSIETIQLTISSDYTKPKP